MVLDELRGHPTPFLAEAILQRLIEKVLYNTERVAHINRGKLSSQELMGVFNNFLRKESEVVYNLKDSGLHQSFKVWLVDNARGLRSPSLWKGVGQPNPNPPLVPPKYTTQHGRPDTFQWETLQELCKLAIVHGEQYTAVEDNNKPTTLA